MNKQEIAHGVSDLIADVLQLRNSEQFLDGHRDEISEWDSLGHLRIFMAIACSLMKSNIIQADSTMAIGLTIDMG